jgi:hypothetical protein
MGDVDMTAYLALALRVLLAVVFGAAAYGKLRRPSALTELASVVTDLVGVRGGLARACAVAVPVTECVIVGLLVGPAGGRYGAGLAVLAAAAFAAGVVRAIQRGSTATCRCFGGVGNRLGPVHLARNATLTCLALAAVVLTWSAPTVTDVAPVVMSVVAGAIGGALVVRWEDLAAVLRGSAVSSQERV